MTVRRAIPFLVMVSLLAGACSSEPSLTEYAAELEATVAAHNEGMDANDAWLDGDTQTIDRVHTYARTRMDLRNSFLSEMEAARPPGEAEELHTAALAALRSLVDAETVLFDKAISSDSLSELGDLWATPAGQAARAADAQAIAICQAAEAAINSTEERQALVGMPWVPTELQEVVKVAFGCLAADR